MPKWHRRPRQPRINFLMRKWERCYHALKTLRISLNNGLSLYDSIQLHTHDTQVVFPLLDRHLNAGYSLPEALIHGLPRFMSVLARVPPPSEPAVFLQQLELYLDTLIRMMHSLRRQLVYPCILVIGMVINGFIISYFVVPALIGQLTATAATLPSWLVVLIRAKQAIVAHGLTVGLIGLVLGLIVVTPLKTGIKNLIYWFNHPWDMASLLAFIQLQLDQGVSLYQITTVFKHPHPRYDQFVRLYHREYAFVPAATQAFSLSPNYAALLRVGIENNRLSEALNTVIQAQQTVYKHRLNRLITVLPMIIIGIIGLYMAGFFLLLFQPLIQSIQSL